MAAKAAPEATLRDGALKATVWRNAGEKGDVFSVELTRTWRDQQGNYHDSSRFSPTECLKVAQLAQRAYDTVGALKQEAAPSPYGQANREVFQDHGREYDDGPAPDRGPRR